jgi:hypothetical protein
LGNCLKGELPMSSLHQLHAEKIVPMSRLRQLHAEKIVLLPLLAGLIAGIICLAGALNRVPGGAPPLAAVDHAGPPASQDHLPLRGPG